MTKHQLVPRRSREDRRQLLQQHLSRRSSRVAEVVGGTAAEVAAVSCCFPFAMVDFMVLTMYKVPAGLCRKAMRRRSRRRSLMHYHEEPVTVMQPAAPVERFVTPEADKDVLAFENEMWEKFSKSGYSFHKGEMRQQCHIE
ncbi:hypothetical protein E3N88_43871 [Mikania micrantha]|uniref:Uncharacterized protein n=1 Tax=Mikania micrantha TaxID=192012 RepID=A0A5N6LDW4_9ASTR|nr:hypothetical protein E3N88_43871 [Mikania micrantha]